MNKSNGLMNGTGNGKSKAKVIADWTVMIYMAGDNNLTEEMVWALKELKTGTGQLDHLDLRVVAQLDPSGEGIPTQRYDFFQNGENRQRGNDGDLEHWRARPIEKPTETNTGNPFALRDFIEWGVKRHVARHYMVVLSGHGSGTTEDFLLKDENAADALSIPELKQALEGALQRLGRPTTKQGLGSRAPKKFDILGLDACFMSMVEVCGELSEYADYVIGAEGFEPEAGWPYQRFLQEIRKNPALYKDDPRALAEMNVTTYVDYYSDFDRSAGRSVDLAAIDLNKLRDSGLQQKLARLGKSLKKIVTNRKEASRRDQIVLAHWNAQTYKFDQFVDLYDLCLCLTERFRKSDQVFRNAKDIMESFEDVDNTFVVRSGCAGFAYQHSHGLSIYFPWSIVSKDYDRLQGDWYNFLKAYVEKTRRKERKPEFETFKDAEKRFHEEQCLRDDVKRQIFQQSLRIDAKNDKALVKKVIRTKRGGKRRLTATLGSLHRYDQSRYDQSRYDQSRYDQSRYDQSRFSGERNRWVKNPPVGSGKQYFP